MLDFTLLGQGPTFENALKAYGQGQDMRRQSNVRNALLQHKDDPTGAASELIANGELEQGLALQDRKRGLDAEATRKRVLGGYGTDPSAARSEAMGSGDMQLIGQIQQMDASQRQIAAQNADEMAAVALALKNTPPEQRKATLTSSQMSEWLASKGFKPEQIATFDPTDANLDAIVAQGSTLKDLLAQFKDERTAAFETKKFDETVRHNKATEGTADKNADSRRISATKPRSSGGKRAVSEMSVDELKAIAGVK